MALDRVDEVVDAIQKMNHKEREALLLRLASIDDLIGDLEDVADIVRASKEESTSYDDFIIELEAERGDS